MSVNSTKEFRLTLSDETATERLGLVLHQMMVRSQCSGAPDGERKHGRWVVFLRGQLGVGKTTLVRGLMRGFGYMGAVKSPTFTLVEPYESDDYQVYHFDLYRLVEPEELEFVGLDDYLGGEMSSRSIVLIEWPERGGTALPEADLDIDIGIAGRGRWARLTGTSSRGREAVTSISGQWADIEGQGAERS
ncbi:MAG: tRNA (adenosine(37)-N6)-threonylcarbamoyltransferase complex ATPase subunit type 1 TsaE [Gammaproteobacteria bacterium]|nr:tRNA (adenosine(37)-N6)-threonylcarbamoyltransferase complex ATPase subunit type 1 TsaE [Gammaproteobacteria bacterium]OUU08586.1 MAG: tRNA (adenosine(37)-N6)-threonylcarbamoyltransferase complex ATPase subunit type 1 TsaE [Gammaproteobacteria bacterium TMED34]